MTMTPIPASVLRLLHDDAGPAQSPADHLERVINLLAWAETRVSALAPPDPVLTDVIRQATAAAFRTFFELDQEGAR